MLLFVSHATKDDAAVTAFAERLERAGLAAAGVRLWIDHRDGINPGDNWRAEIDTAVNDCEAGIFLLSPRSCASVECQAEWSMILSLKKPLYVVMLDPVEKRDMPSRLGIIHYVNADAAGAAALVKAITGRAPLPDADPAVMTGKRITGTPDSSLDTPMIGRDGDLDTVKHLITEAPTFITGIGGLGKSRLARALIASDACTGAIWLRAYETTTAEDALVLLRDHLELPGTMAESEVVRRIPAGLLLVIDNGESVSEANRPAVIALIARLRDAGMGVCVTTREAWPRVSPMRAHTPTQLDDAAAAGVVRAFMVEQDIHLTVSEAEATALAIAARRHPFLIGLAVSFLRDCL